MKIYRNILKNVLTNAKLMDIMNLTKEERERKIKRDERTISIKFKRKRGTDHQRSEVLIQNKIILPLKYK